MTGGLLQLVAYGSQDLILSGLPEVTFFKIVYRRYNNFSSSDIDIPFKKVDFGSLSRCIIPFNGDLIDNMMLKLTIPDVRTKYKYSINDEISKILEDNNASIINVDDYHMNIDKLDFLLMICDYNFTTDAGYKVYLVKTGKSKISSNYMLVYDTLKVCNRITTDSTATTYYINNSNERTYLFNNSSLNNELDGLTIEPSSLTNVYTLTLNKITLNDFTDIDDFYSGVNEIIINNDYYCRLLYFLKYLTNSTTDFSIYSCNKYIQELYEYLFDEIVLQTEYKIYNIIEISKPTKTILKTYSITDYGTDRVKITNTGDISSQFNSGLDEFDILCIYSLGTKSTSISAFLLVKKFITDTTTNGIVSYISCNLLENDTTLLTSISNIITNTTFNLDEWSYSDTVYLSDGNTSSGHFAVITELSISSGTYTVTVGSDIQDSDSWGYLELDKLLYIYEDSISESSKTPIAYLRVVSVADYSSGNTVLTCVLPKYYITDGNTTHTAEILSISSSIIKVSTDIETDWGLDSIYVFYIYTTSSFSSKIPVGYFLKSSITRTDSYTYITVTDPPNNDITTIVKGAYFVKTNEETMIQIGTLTNIEYDSYCTYKFIHESDTTIRYLSTTEYRSLVNTSIEKAITTNLYILRNVFNSLFKNDHICYRSYILDKTDDDETTNVDGYTNEIGTDLTRWATFINYFYRVSIDSSSTIYSNTTTNGLTPYIDYINTKLTAYKSTTQSELSSTMSTTISITTYSMINEIAKTISYYQHSSLAYTVVVNGNFQSSTGVFNVYDHNTLGEMTDLLGTITVTGSDSESSSTLTCTYLSGTYMAVATVGNYISSTSLGTFKITSVSDTFIDDISTKLTTYLSSTDLIDLFDSPSDYEKAFNLNYLLVDYTIKVYDLINKCTTITDTFKNYVKEGIMKIYHTLKRSLSTYDSYSIGNGTSTKTKINLFTSLDYDGLVNKTAILNDLITSMKSDDEYLTEFELLLTEFSVTIPDGATETSLVSLIKTYITDTGITSSTYDYDPIIDMYSDYMDNYYSLFEDLFDVEENIGRTTIEHYELIRDNENIVFSDEIYNVDNFNLDTLKITNQASVIYSIPMSVESFDDITSYLYRIVNNITKTGGSLEYYNNNKNLLKVKYIPINETLYYSTTGSEIQTAIYNILTTNGSFKSAYSHTDTDLYTNATASVFTTTKNALTIDSQSELLVVSYQLFENDSFLLNLIQTGFETDFGKFVIQTNILNTYEYMVENSGLTGISDINDYLANYAITKTSNDDHDFFEYTQTFKWYKNCVVTETEETSLETAIDLIDVEDEDEKIVREEIEEIWNGDDDDKNNIKQIIFDVILNKNNLEKYGTDLITKIENTFADRFRNYNNATLDDDKRNYYLYKYCIITEIEKNYITTNNELPSTLSYYDSTEEIVVRTTSLPYGFTYDSDTETLTRFRIFDSNYKSLIDDFGTYKTYLLENGSFLKQGEDDDSNFEDSPSKFYYSELRNMLLSKHINPINLLLLVKNKDNALISLLSSYDSNYMYNQSITDDDLTYIKYLDTIVNDVRYNQYGTVKIDDSYDTTTEYQSASIDNTSIVDIDNKINNLTSEISRISANITSEITTQDNNYDSYNAVSSQIALVQNRTSDYANFGWIRKLGVFLIEYLEFKINGQIIDRQSGDFINIFYELSKEKGKINGYKEMIGDTDDLYTLNNEQKYSKTLYVPLYLWFCRKHGLALPIIAMQHCNIEVFIKFRQLDDVCARDNYITYVKKPKLKAQLMTNYIHLDESERKIFAESVHEYLIEQVQYNGGLIVNSVNASSRLMFSNPCKDIIWVLQKKSFIEQTGTTHKQYHNYTDTLMTDYTDDTTLGTNPIITAILKFNGQYRFEKREGKYFNYVQPWQYYNSSPIEGINVYSFALYPLEFQPSGSYNLSFIGDSELVLETSNIYTNDVAELRIYARSYNILRVMSGLAGLAYFS